MILADMPTLSHDSSPNLDSEISVQSFCVLYNPCRDESNDTLSR